MYYMLHTNVMNGDIVVFQKKNQIPAQALINYTTKTNIIVYLLILIYHLLNKSFIIFKLIMFKLGLVCCEGVRL